MNNQRDPQANFTDYFNNRNNQPFDPNLNNNFQDQKPIFVPQQQNDFINNVQSQNTNLNFNPDANAQFLQNQNGNLAGDFTQNHEQKKDEIKPKPNLKIVFLLIGVILGISLLSLGVFAIIQRNSMPVKTVNQVGVEFSGPKTAGLGSAKEWSIKVSNNNNVAMYNTTLVMMMDSGFKFIKNNSDVKYDPSSTTYFLDKIDPGQVKIIKFTGSLAGAVGDDVSLQAKVIHSDPTIGNKTPQNYSLNSSPFVTKITVPDVKMEVVKSKDLVEKGGELELKVVVENIADQDMLDTQIRAEYPLESFSYVSSNLDFGSNKNNGASSGNSVWNINRLEKNKKVTLTIKGEVKPEARENMSFNFVLQNAVGNQNYQQIINTSTTVNTIEKALSLTTIIENKKKDDLIKPNEELNILIKYHNKSSRTLNDVQIISSLNDPAEILDWSTIKWQNATGTLNGKSITWRAASTPDLVSIAPNQSGFIKYNIKTKEATNFYNSNLAQDKYILKPAAQVSATDRQAVSATSEKEYKAIGFLDMTQTVEILDDVKNTSFASDNYDKVGTFKVARVKWSFETRQNKIEKVVVEASTPLLGNVENSDVFAVSSVKPTNLANKIQYNPKTGQIKLEIDSLETYLGLAKPKFEVEFELKVKPDSHTKDYDQVLVLRPTKLTGTDNFTEEDYEKEIQQFIIKPRNN